MASFRWLAAGTALVALLSIRGERLPGPGTWMSLALVGVLLMGIGNGAVVWAEQTVPSGLTAVLIAAIPFWMVGIERLMHGGERLTAWRAGGLVLGFSGIVLLVWPELRLGDGRSFLPGVLATQLACLGWAVGSSLAKRRGQEENVLAAAAVQMIFAGLALLIVGSARGEWAQLAFNSRTSLALAYLIVVGSIVGYSAYAYSLKHLPVATVSLYAYANPVIAVVLGALMLAEPIHSRILVAAGVILAGSAMVRTDH
jgi:drug/metabolite transporter (DMT)-like permease